MFVFGAHPEWFGFLYALAFLVAFVVAAVVGYRRGWPLAPWLLVLAAAGIGGVVGTRLLPLGLAGLQTFLDTGALPDATTKRIPGAIAGSLALAIAARWALGMRHSVLDPLAYSGLAALAVARVGCLVAGCCFGTPTDGWWGVTYAGGSFAHGFHLAHGIVPAGAALPHAVHAVPLYDVAFALVGLALLPALSRRLRAAGSLCWTTVGAYAVFRFAQDFVREGELAVAGLTRIQWLALGATAASFAYVALRERHARRQPDEAPAPANAPGLGRMVLLFAGLVAAFLALQAWLTGPEPIILAVRLIPAGVAVAVAVWRQHAPARVRWSATTFAAGLPLVVGAQVAAPDSTAERFSFLAVEAHAVRGQFEEFDICATDILEYRGAGVGLAHVTADLDRAFTREIGVRVYGAEQSYADPDRQARAVARGELAQNAYVVAPYAQFEGEYVGGLLAANVGQVPFLDTGENEVPHFVPSASIRLGPRRFHLHTGALDGAQFGAPAPALRIGLGTGWLTPAGQEARVQAGLSGSGVYALAAVPLDRVTIEPMVATGGAAGIFHTGVRIRAQLGATRAPERIPALVDAASSSVPDQGAAVRDTSSTDGEGRSVLLRRR